MKRNQNGLSRGRDIHGGGTTREQDLRYHAGCIAHCMWRIERAKTPAKLDAAKLDLEGTIANAKTFKVLPSDAMIAIALVNLRDAIEKARLEEEEE